MGFFDALLGRSKPKRANLDDLFALPPAALTLQAATGFTPTGVGAVAFRQVEGAAFQSAESESVALIGSVVRVYYNGDESTKETFLMGTRGEGSGKEDLEIYSPDSPLGRALLGAKVGETREYEAPNGKTVSVTVMTAEPYKS